MGAFITYGGAWTIGALFGPLYESEDDMSRNVKIFLAATALLVVFGGFVGNKFYKQ